MYTEVGLYSLTASTILALLSPPQISLAGIHFFSSFYLRAAVMMVKDDWVSAAITDDLVVVELLMRLKQSQASLLLKSPLPVVIPLRWGLRQPRSKMPSSSICDGVSQRSKDADSTRCSPTTPLSWSGGASHSSTADGFEETSRSTSLSHTTSRSKGTAKNDSIGTTSKRARRKKTLSELRTEENLLLKERFHLKEELASANATFKEQTANNESLKKVKLNINEDSSRNFSPVFDGPKSTSFSQTPQRVEGSLETTPALPIFAAHDDDGMQSESCCVTNNIDPRGDVGFVVPDLNMIPEDDFGA